MAGVLALTTVGCSGTTPGDPSATSGSSTVVAPSSAPSSKPSLPPRPREIKLDGVDPCALWTAAQLQELALDPTPNGGGQQSRENGNAFCGFSALENEAPNIGFDVEAVRSRDASDLLIEDSNGVSTTVTDVAGFPAVRETGPDGSSRPCRLAMSVAQGQFLDVSLEYGSTREHLPVEQACELTLKAATFAMQTLQTQR